MIFIEISDGNEMGLLIFEMGFVDFGKLGKWAGHLLEEERGR